VTTNFIAILVGDRGDRRRAELEKQLMDRTRALADSDERLEVVDQPHISLAAAVGWREIAPPSRPEDHIDPQSINRRYP
jgi:hypothetical protein